MEEFRLAKILAIKYNLTLPLWKQWPVVDRWAILGLFAPLSLAANELCQPFSALPSESAGVTVLDQLLSFGEAAMPASMNERCPGHTFQRW